MSHPPPYNVFVIPTPASEKHVELYTEIRLAALSTNPEAFGSTYERESTFTKVIWSERLNTRGRTTLAAVVEGEDSPIEKWIGTLAVLSPEMLMNIPQEPPYPFCIAEKEKNGEIYVYLLVGMWVHPEHRGRGVGKKLIEHALHLVFTYQAEMEGCKKKVVLLEVHRTNKAASNLYTKTGFKKAHQRGKSLAMGKVREKEEEEEEEEYWMIQSL